MLMLILGISDSRILFLRKIFHVSSISHHLFFFNQYFFVILYKLFLGLKFLGNPKL